MKTAMKRFLSLLLALTMVLSMVPATAFAAEAEETETVPVTEPAQTTAAPETEVPETEAPETEAPETEAPETEAAETEAVTTEVEIPDVTAPLTYVVADYIEWDIQLPRVDMALDQLPEDDNRFFEVYDFYGIECVRNYIGKTDPSGGYVAEVPGDYKGYDGQYLAAVLEFEGVAENGVLTIFDENTTVVINGTQCPTELLDEGTRIRATYVYQLQTIEVYYAHLNIPAPVAGEEAVFEAEYASPTGDRYEIGAGEGISATNGIRWIVGDSQKALKPGDKFESGHYYKALIYIKSGIGCRFAANVDATVSGAVDVYVSTYYSTETYDQYDPDIYRVVVAEFNLEGEYDIYVENGFAYSQDGDLIGSAKPGDIVTLKPGEPPKEDIEGIENWSFSGWEVVTPDNSIFVEENGDTLAETTIVMPAEPVHVQCIFDVTEVEEVNLSLGGYGIGSYVECMTVTEDADGAELGYVPRYGTNYAIYDGPKGTPNSLLPAGTVIEEGETYWLKVTLNPVPGYSLDGIYFAYYYDNAEYIKLDGVAAKEIYLNDDGSLDVAFLLSAPTVLPTGKITVENGYTYLNTSSEPIQEAPAGTHVWLSSVVPDELAETHWFSHWVIVKGDVEIDIYEPHPGFVMPEGDVELKAVFLPVIRNVYVTMDLPEAGETPVYTAESLTEGVSIGEIIWTKSAATHEEDMDPNEVLEYEMGYRVQIELIVDDEHTFADAVEGEFNGEFFGASLTEEGRWFLDYYYDTGARKYSITVDGGYAKYFSTEVITSAAAGEAILVEAIIPEGCIFDHWEVLKGDVTIGWPDVEEFEFTMPAEDVAFKAVFTDLKDLPLHIVDGNFVDAGEIWYQDINERNTVYLMARKGDYSDFREIEATWTTSNASVATVENGVITIHKPGTATITAKDAYGCKDSVEITGYYVANGKLSAKCEVPEIGLEVGQSTFIQIFGEFPIDSSPIDYDQLTFTVSKPGIVTLNSSTGEITGVKAGTVTVTAMIRGDLSAGRKASVKITVIDPQVENITVSYTYVNAVEEETVWLDEGTCYTIVYLDSEDFANSTGTINLTPRAMDALGNELPLKKSLFKWTSSNSKVAKLKANADGTATLTIPKKAAGMSRITLTANDKSKTEQIFVVHVRDYAPKLEETKFTLDWWKEDASVPLNLTASYGNTIWDAAVYEYDKKTKDYTVPSSNFGVTKDEDGNFSLVFGWGSTIQKGTVKASLNVSCADGKTYRFLISITVQNKQPKVTLAQFGKLDTFYRDSQVSLGQSISTSGENAYIESIKAVGDNKTITVLPGTMTLAFTEAFRNGEIEKVDPNMVLEIKCDGYKPFEITYKVATQTSKVTVVSDPGKLTVTPANTEKSVDFKLVDKETGENLSAYVVEEKVYIPKAAYLGLELKNNGTPADVTDDYLTATFTEYAPTNKTAAYEITTPVQKDNWREIKWTGVKITYTPKTPTVSLDKKTLTLNNTFTEREDQAIATISDAGLSRWDLDFELKCTDKGGTKAWTTAQQLEVVCKDGVITAKFKDPDAVVEPAKCKFEAIPEINGIKLAKVSVTVDVKADTSKVRIDYSTVKLNTYMARYEIFSTDAFMGNDLELLGFKENGNEDVEIWYADGLLHTKLKTSDPDSKYVFELTPKVKDELTGQVVYTPTKLKFTVQTYRNDKITIEMDTSGTLDTLNPDSAMYVYVSKLTNAAGGHEKVRALVGRDGHLFDYSVDEYGQITLKLKPGQTYDTSKTYLLRFTYEVFNQTVVSNDVKVKVTQGKYKAVISPPNALVTLSSRKTTTLLFSVSLTGAEGARLDKDSIQLNTSKTAAALDRAIGSVSVRSVSADGRLATVAVTITHKDYLDSGKKYVLAFDVTPVGNASDVKPAVTTVKVVVQ